MIFDRARTRTRRISLPLVAALLPTVLGTPASASAQDTGPVSFPEVGVAFTIPQGWLGQASGDGYVMGSRSEAGFMILSGHEATTTGQLMQEARAGLSDPMSGISLQIVGEPELLENDRVGAAYEGTLGGSPARVYAVGVLNPHGSGVLILAASDPADYSDRYPALAREVGGSLHFTPVSTQAASTSRSDAERDWDYLLGGTRLTWTRTIPSTTAARTSPWAVATRTRRSSTSARRATSTSPVAPSRASPEAPG